MYWLKILDIDTILHHTICISAFIYTLLGDAGSFYNVIALVGGEFSNPFMHIRAMLRSLNMRYTKLYDTAQTFFFVTYLFARIVLGHLIVYVTWICESNPLLIKLCSFGIILQSYLNIYRIYFVWKGAKQ